jgi:type II secretory pathway pseudopilin PulG
MLRLDFDRGDTIIEVLFAITVFSLVVVGSLSIMNQGSATAQRSLEISLVRNEIDAQAETLRFLNASYVASYQSGLSDCASGVVLSNIVASQWHKINCELASTTEASIFGTCPVSAPSGSFIIDTKKATVSGLNISNFKSASTFAQLKYDNPIMAEGIWIEAVKPNITTGNNQDNADYIDFHIRACWDNPGQSVPLTIGTIVRLYEPRG